VQLGEERVLGLAVVPIHNEDTETVVHLRINSMESKKKKGKKNAIQHGKTVSKPPVPSI
jgi:hypothetical protein